MLICELFNNGDDMMKQLRQEVLNFLTPFLGQNVPFVTIQQVIDALKNDQFGIAINRNLIMQILDPESVQAISRIDGDRIYLNFPKSSEHESSENEQIKDQEHVKNKSQQQAKKNVQK